MTKPVTIEQVKACALRLLARREHSITELTQKLLLRHFPEQMIQAVLQPLTTAGWQSDLRFASAYVQEQIQRGYGLLKITAELKKRGIAKDIIAEVLPTDDAFWQQQLGKLWHNKNKSTTKTPAQQQRFWQARGFTWQQIHSTVFKNEQ